MQKGDYRNNGDRERDTETIDHREETGINVKRQTEACSGYKEAK